MSTYSTSLGLEEITPGDQAGLWGNTTNTNLSLIDQAIAGVTPVNLGSASGSTYVLTYYNGAVDESRSAVIKVTGTATGPNIIQIPAVQKLYVFRNNSGDQITVQTAAAANTVTLKDGEATLVFCDGANAYSGIATAGVGTITVPYGGTGATSFGAGFILSPGGTGNLFSVARVPLDATSSAVTGILPIANGGTGQSTLPSGSILTGNGTIGIGSISALATPGWVLTTNGSSWAAAPAGSALLSSNNIWSGTNAFSTAPTVGGSALITSSALSGYAQLASSPTFTGTVSGSAFIATGASSIGDQKFTVAYTSGGTTYNAGLSPTALQLGTSGVGAYYDPTVSNSFRIITAFGANATFRNDGLNYQGNLNTAWYNPSDINIKTNIRPISAVLDKINALKPCHFEYKHKVGEVRTGFIAQEFETVFPGHVEEGDADENFRKFLPEGQTKIKGITQDLIPYLVQAIQELSAEVTALKAKVGA